MKNVAWMLARHRSLTTVSKMILSESKEMEEAGLDAVAEELLRIESQVEKVKFVLGKLEVGVGGVE